MIAEKPVIKYGSGSGHIVLPYQMIGQKVWVVSKEDASSLKELIEKTLIMRNIDRLDSKEFSEKFHIFQRDICYRITRLENVVYGTKQEVAKKE